MRNGKSRNNAINHIFNKTQKYAMPNNILNLFFYFSCFSCYFNAHFKIAPESSVHNVFEFTPTPIHPPSPTFNYYCNSIVKTTYTSLPVSFGISSFWYSSITTTMSSSLRSFILVYLLVTFFFSL